MENIFVFFFRYLLFFYRALYPFFTQLPLYKKKLKLANHDFFYVIILLKENKFSTQMLVRYNSIR